MTLDETAVIASQQFVADVFRSFRETLLEQYGSAEFTTKSDRSQVTELDVAVERSLRAGLADAFPQFGCAGEEMGSDGVEDGRPYWLVDPIDGTSSFIRGLPNCTNMAALIIANQPVAAVLYDFVNDVLYTARKGGGAYRNSERLEVSDRTLDESVLYMGGFMIPDQFFKPLRAANVDIFRPIGASGHAYILLAEGKIEGYSLMDGAVSAHDHAPGMLLAREAGAVVSCAEDTDWDVRASNFIVSTPRIARLLSENGMQ